MAAGSLVVRWYGLMARSMVKGTNPHRGMNSRERNRGAGLIGGGRRGLARRVDPDHQRSICDGSRMKTSSWARGLHQRSGA
jgi:hypothetical protein